MMKLPLALLAVLWSVFLNAQLLHWSPAFPTENKTDQALVITIDAAKGNRGLYNYANTGDVYVHLGVITNKSTGPGNWRYVKFNQSFSQPNPALQAVYAGNNQWRFTITGSLRTYFGLTDATETIEKIAILFRNGNGTLKQANSDGSDMYLPVYREGLAIRIISPPLQPLYQPKPEESNALLGPYPLTVVVNGPATIIFYKNGQAAGGTTSYQPNDTVRTNILLDAPGFYQLVATAGNGAPAASDTINITAGTVGAPVAPLPAGVRDGINYEAGGTAATLVLRAPGKNLVTVIGDFNNWTETTGSIMNKTPDGTFFWLRLTGLTPGTEYAYQYRVDNALTIADPYAEKILDPYNNNDLQIPAATYPGLKAYPTGKTTGIVGLLQTAAPAYNWTTGSFSRPDKRGLVIYELLLRDFVAAHDWKTLQDTLSYLQNLGVNAIELLPFNEFEGNLSWGYNPDFYFAPDKYYGPGNTLKAFVDACHSRGIAVIMDIALNHQFGLSPMVQLYWDAQNNRPAANSPWFNPEAKHPFNVGYDMNHESLHTRYFTGRVVEHWLKEYRIDGFRFDLSKGFTQVASGSDVAAWSRYDASRVALWKGYYDTVQTKSTGAYVILEHLSENEEERELSDYGMLLWGNLNDSYAEAAMGWLDRSNFEWGIHTVRNWSRPHLVTYMESHDEERLAYKNINFGNSAGSYNIKDTATALKRVELDAAFFFTIPGPKMIWQFGELGYDYPINYCPDGTVNNACRVDPKPIRWDYRADPRRRHVYDVFSSLIKLRFHPWYRDAFMSNRVERSLGGAFKWMRLTTDTSNLLVVGNFGVTATTGTVTFQNSGVWYDYLNGTTFTATGGAQEIALQPGAFHVYVNRNVNNITPTPVSGLPAAADGLELKVFPNPAAASFSIDLRLPRSGAVRIDLLNAQGQTVARLRQSFLPRGRHQLSWNRKDLPVAGGTYYLQLQTSSTYKTVPVTLQ